MTFRWDARPTNPVGAQPDEEQATDPIDEGTEFMYHEPHEEFRREASGMNSSGKGKKREKS